ncbi:hypothetical protein YC2023_079799 [Brassica napus]
MPRGAEGVATRSRVLSDFVSESRAGDFLDQFVVGVTRKRSQETADEVGREEDVRPPGVKASKAAKRKKHGNEAAFDQIETILAAKNMLSKQKILDRLLGNAVSPVQGGGCVDGCRSLFLYVSNQVTGGTSVITGVFSFGGKWLKAMSFATWIRNPVTGRFTFGPSSARDRRPFTVSHMVTLW